MRCAINGQVRNSWFDSSEYGTSTEGKKELLNILYDENAENIFSTPKPIKLYKKLVEMSIFPNAEHPIVLDFFAGSGTTGQAVLEFNNENSKNVNFILCTNNENNICENVTYKRLERVINGYIDGKSKKVEGLNSNLKYYKTTYIPKINTEKENIHENLLFNIKNLIQLENGINVDDKKVRIILDEEKIDQFSGNKEEVKECEKLYISSDILLTAKQNMIFKKNNVEVFIIPEYYFDEEIKEVL